MTYLEPQLAVYQKVRRERRTQIDQGLQQLHQEIEQQIERLRQQEETSVEAEKEALSQIRPSIETDARCLISTPELATYAQSILSKSFCTLPDAYQSAYFNPDPTKWRLSELPHPVQILEYLLDRDDYACKDDTFYTNWLYWLTVKMGDYQQKFYIATASLIPSSLGDPAKYHPLSPITQYYAYRRELKLDGKKLKLNQSQLVLVEQELSCLLVAVGDLFNLQTWTEHFCYPKQQWDK